MPFISIHISCAFALFNLKCLTLMLVTLHSFCLHSESPNADQESDETIRREDAPVFYSVCSKLFFLSKSPDPGLGDKVLNSQVTYAVSLNREWLDAGELNPVRGNQRGNSLSLCMFRGQEQEGPWPAPSARSDLWGRRCGAGGQGERVRGQCEAEGVSGWEGAAATSWPDEEGPVWRAPRTDDLWNQNEINTT